LHDHEGTGATPGPHARELAELYLSTLEDLMDPKEYADLKTFISAVYRGIAEPIDPDDPSPERHLDIDLTPAVIDEWLIFSGILSNGSMDQRIVEIGDGSRTVVDGGIADDPEALRDFCERQRERNRIREEERKILKGIESAST
jgi:hypothetical protein